jgi:hypothetical protein
MYTTAFVLNREGTEFHRRHNAEPVNERLLNLCDMITQEGADVSLCYNPISPVPFRIIILSEEQPKAIKRLEDNPFMKRHYAKLSGVD